MCQPLNFNESTLSYDGEASVCRGHQKPPEEEFILGSTDGIGKNRVFIKRDTVLVEVHGTLII
jgi:hypothetical protein